MPVTLLTDTAVELIRTAAGDGSAVAVSHIALGDGLGVAYDPAHAQTGLRRELVRVPIERRSALGNDSWRVKAEFGPGTPAFAVREMGFFDAAGRMIAIWAGADVAARQTGVITYIVDHILNFSRIDTGLVLVDAPDDDLFDFAVTMLAEQAATRLHMFQMNERIPA